VLRRSTISAKNSHHGPCPKARGERDLEQCTTNRSSPGAGPLGPHRTHLMCVKSPLEQLPSPVGRDTAYPRVPDLVPLPATVGSTTAVSTLESRSGPLRGSDGRCGHGPGWLVCPVLLHAGASTAITVSWAETRRTDLGRRRRRRPLTHLPAASSPKQGAAAEEVPPTLRAVVPYRGEERWDVCRS